MKHLKLSILLLSLFSLSLSMKAQVTLGSSISPAKGALLELKSEEKDLSGVPAGVDPITHVDNVTSTKGGLVLPRVMLVNKNTLEPFVTATESNANAGKLKEKHAGLMVYNIYVSAETETDSNKRFKQGVYTWDGAKWILETKDDSRYFYIPSFNIPLAAIGVGKTFDLYDQYKKQFTKTGNTAWISSNATLTTIPSPSEGRLYTRAELDYAITYYDKSILENISIANSGVMTYDIKSLNTTPDSFINVVFIVK